MVSFGSSLASAGAAGAFSLGTGLSSCFGFCSVFWAVLDSDFCSGFDGAFDCGFDCGFDSDFWAGFGAAFCSAGFFSGSFRAGCSPPLVGAPFGDVWSDRAGSSVPFSPRDLKNSHHALSTLFGSLR